MRAAKLPQYSLYRPPPFLVEEGSKIRSFNFYETHSIQCDTVHRPDFQNLAWETSP